MAKSKKALYLTLAEHYFIDENMTYIEIAGKIDVSEKTLRKWSQEHKWLEKRKELIESKAACHKEIYELIRVLSKSIKDDLKAGTPVSDSRFNNLNKLTSMVSKAKKYEDEIKEENTDKKALNNKKFENQIKDIFGLER